MVSKKTKDKAYNTASINRILFLIVTSAILIQGLIWLVDSFYLVKSDIEDVTQIQTDYIKAELRERVASVIDYSDYKSKETENFLREELLSRTYEAHVLMTSIYESNKDTKSKDEIEKMIKDALREIRFNNGRGYIFIDTLEGDVILYPVFPNSEGENLIDLQDEKGNYVLKEEIQLVKSQGEGFIEGYWKNPNAEDEKAYKKVTFVKAFEPYGWYLGCGDYLDEIRKEIQAEVMDYVDSIRYGEDDLQYIFIHDNKGVELANGLYPDYVGVNNYDLEDSNGAKIIQEQIQLCSGSSGGYLIHYWPKVDGDGQYKKLTYVAPLPKWKWIIGSGLDITDLDELIKSKEKQLNNFIWKRVIVILAVLSILIFVSRIYVNIFMVKVKKNFSVFRDYMISAKMKLIPIDISSLDYDDFSELAEVTNSMTERINQLLHYDELTHIYNRRYIKEIFGNMYIDFPNNTSIIVMDIDYFKKVNDSFGHSVGDDALVTTASLIETEVGNSGAVGRFGGEEFIVVLTNFSLEETVEVAEGIRKRIESHYIESIEGNITISSGVAHSSGLKKDDLFKQADKKLYQAKELGRNRTEY